MELRLFAPRLSPRTFQLLHYPGALSADQWLVPWVVRCRHLELERGKYQAVCSPLPRDHLADSAPKDSYFEKHTQASVKPPSAPVENGERHMCRHWRKHQRRLRLA